MAKECMNWEVSISEARKIQKEMAEKVVFSPFGMESFLVAGIDVSCHREEHEFSGAIVVMTYPGFEVIEVSNSRAPEKFPYVPGFLSFREAPAVIEAWRKLKNEPDLLVFDGQGIAHPGKCGLASHLGIVLDKPSIGCAKSHLFGEKIEPGLEKGDFSNITDPRDGSVTGVVLRTRKNVSPVYVSVGHKMDLESAVKVIMKLSPKYRIPEPLRLAHYHSKEGWKRP